MDKQQAVEKDIICPDCGSGPFKTEQGLAGHRKIAHNVQIQKIDKQEILKKLENLETGLASTINSEKAIDSEERTIVALKLLLPACEKYKLGVGPFVEDKTKSTWYAPGPKKYVVVRDIQKSAMLGSGYYGKEV